MGPNWRDTIFAWMRPRRTQLVDAISRIEQKDETLVHLNLRNTNMTNQDLKKLRHAIRSNHNQTLVSLDISCNLLTDEGLKEFEDWPTLTFLNISANHFGKQGIASICKNNNIKHLSARQNKLDHEAAILLAQQTQYEALDLGSNNLQDQGAKALARCPSLLILDISDNHITGDGIAEFSSHSSLTHLIARINKISDEGFNRCLSQNIKLTYLDMGNNALICPTSIGDHPSLIYFRGYANQINDEGAVAIARNSRLKVVLLNVNRITSTGAELLHAANYFFLDLTGNRDIQHHSMKEKVFLSDAQYQKCNEKFPPMVILREESSSPASKALRYAHR